jgi:hypothetical protein
MRALYHLPMSLHFSSESSIWHYERKGSDIRHFKSFRSGFRHIPYKVRLGVCKSDANRGLGDSSHEDPDVGYTLTVRFVRLLRDALKE